MRLAELEAKVCDEDGDVDERAFDAFRTALIEAFLNAPEGEPWDGANVDLLVDYGVNYVGVLPSKLTSVEVREIVFEVIPRKVSISPAAADEIVGELRAFFRFAQRALGYERASNCLRVLMADDAVDELADQLGSPENWGMAKSFFMEGQARGYDLSNEAGLQRWVNDYNAGVAYERGDPSPPLLSPLQRALVGASGGERGARKAKRKAQKKARRRSR